MTSIACYDCEHDCDDHDDTGCKIAQCPCTETPATLYELATGDDE